MRVITSWILPTIVVTTMAYAGTALATEATSPAAAPPTKADPATKAEPSEPRPAPLSLLLTRPPAWRPYSDLSAGVVAVERLAAPGKDSLVRLKPGVGMFIGIGIPLLQHLHVTGYLIEANQGLVFPRGSLGVPGSITSDSVHTYVFGIRISPSFTLGEGFRAWGTLGAGWGRMQYRRMDVSVPGGDGFFIPPRDTSIVEIPIGFGLGYEIIPKWLAIQAEVTGAWVPSQTGNARESGGFAVASGKQIQVGPLPNIDASFAQTLALVFHL